MIRIIAATAPDGEPKIAPPKGKHPQAPLPQNMSVPSGMPSSQSIPLADDDEMIPIGDVQGQPVYQIAPPPTPEQLGQQPQATPVAPTSEPMPEGMSPDEFEEIQQQPEQQAPQPEPEEEAPFPEDEFEEITEEKTELDRMNETFSIGQKIDAALAEGYPLRIIYTTLKGNTTERTVRPDYYLPARTTGNWVLIAWCELRQDWRGFIVDRIRAAKLEPKNE